jgi:hypothetical protein
LGSALSTIKRQFVSKFPNDVPVLGALIKAINETWQWAKASISEVPKLLTTWVRNFIVFSNFSANDKFF